MHSCKTLARARRIAFHSQDGRCYYCGQPTWLGGADVFALTHGLTKRQASILQCTAEHLIAREDGGSDSRGNIVAACLTCNRGRHARRKKMSAERFRRHVQASVASGRWHSKEVLASFQGKNVSDARLPQTKRHNVAIGDSSHGANHQCGRSSGRERG